MHKSNPLLLFPSQLVGTLEHKQRIQCAVFATDDYVVCGGDDKYIYVWKATGE